MKSQVWLLPVEKPLERDIAVARVQITRVVADVGRGSWIAKAGGDHLTAVEIVQFGVPLTEAEAVLLFPLLAGLPYRGDGQ